MNTKIQFQKNAPVLTANGEQVGSLNRLVVDPNTMMLTDIVIRTGALFNQEERVVPIALIAETTEDQIILSEDMGDLKTFPPFEEDHIVDTEEDVQHPSPLETELPIIYGSPILFGMPLQSTPNERFVTHIDQNIPEGTVAVKEGAKVITADGNHVGNLERVFTDAPYEHITHLLVSSGMFANKTKLIPVEWVKDMNENEINLQVYKTSIDALADTKIINH